jgi:hypothetical protein
LLIFFLGVLEASALGKRRSTLVYLIFIFFI